MRFFSKKNILVLLPMFLERWWVALACSVPIPVGKVNTAQMIYDILNEEMFRCGAVDWSADDKYELYLQICSKAKNFQLLFNFLSGQFQHFHFPLMNLRQSCLTHALEGNAVENVLYLLDFEKHWRTLRTVVTVTSSDFTKATYTLMEPFVFSVLRYDNMTKVTEKMLRLDPGILKMQYNGKNLLQSALSLNQKEHAEIIQRIANEVQERAWKNSFLGSVQENPAPYIILGVFLLVVASIFAVKAWNHYRKEKQKEDLVNEINDILLEKNEIVALEEVMPSHLSVINMQFSSEKAYHFLATCKEDRPTEGDVHFIECLLQMTYASPADRHLVKVHSNRNTRQLIITVPSLHKKSIEQQNEMRELLNNQSNRKIEEEFNAQKQKVEAERVKRNQRAAGMRFPEVNRRSLPARRRGGRGKVRLQVPAGNNGLFNQFRQRFGFG